MRGDSIKDIINELQEDRKSNLNCDMSSLPSKGKGYNIHTYEKGNPLGHLLKGDELEMRDGNGCVTV